MTITRPLWLLTCPWCWMALTGYVTGADLGGPDPSRGAHYPRSRWQ